VILLEDDLFVSPKFHIFATKALNYYATDEEVGGISLSSILKNGFVNLPFIPLLDDSDVFFAQFCVLHGFIISDKMWASFEQWFEYPANQKFSKEDNIHTFFKKMDNQSEWFHFFTNFLIKSKKYIIYPREAYCVHFQEVGTHFNKTGIWFQNPLQYFKQDFNFKHLSESKVRYDSFLELEPEIIKSLNPEISNFDFEIDFYASKSSENVKSEYVLTSRPVKNSVFSFGKVMKPFEMNIIEKIHGKELHLAKKSDVKFGKFHKFIVQRSNYFYLNSGSTIKQKIIFTFLGVLSRLKLI